MATVTLHSKITIGKFKPFVGVHDVVTKKSLSNYMNTAIIKLPASSRLKQTGLQTKSVQTAQIFERGDKVKIELGYNSVLTEEFVGFVNRINMKVPCEIECEGYSFLLRFKVINKVWKDTTLEEVLSYIIKGTDIELGTIDHVPFSNIQLIQQDGASCLKLLKKFCGNVLNIWFDDNIINAGLKYNFYTEKNKENKPDVVFKLGWNTVGRNQMKLRKKGDNKVTIHFFKDTGDGNKIESFAGNNGGYIQKKLQNIANKSTMDKLAADAEHSHNYSGYDGKIVGFLNPICKPGYKVKLLSDRYPELAGNYLCEGVTTTYGKNGAKRNCKISFEL